MRSLGNVPWERVSRESEGSTKPHLTRLSPNLRSGPFPSHGVVAQLVRASACHAEGRGFESRPSRQITTTYTVSVCDSANQSESLCGNARDNKCSIVRGCA